ncbi:hypothetical protein [Phytohabitans kaempferiae]|uniref:Secreted protein n=1 Tax=Phytohabitans kaempferiae TaxID=1620943 RepID=A0ABV6M7A5_9ACTN
MTSIRKVLRRALVIAVGIVLAVTVAPMPASAHEVNVAYRGTSMKVTSSHRTATICTYGNWQVQGELRLSNGTMVVLIRTQQGCNSKIYSVNVREFRVCSWRYSPARCSSWFTA